MSEEIARQFKVLAARAEDPRWFLVSIQQLALSVTPGPGDPACPSSLHDSRWVQGSHTFRQMLIKKYKWQFVFLKILFLYIKFSWFGKMSEFIHFNFKKLNEHMVI